ncbi:hypothetical protein D3C76_1613910 [compost metagenome]
MIHGEIISDIGGTAHRDPIGDGALRDGGGKTLRMPDDPVRHEPAVTAAGNAQPLRVDRGIGRQSPIGEFHQIVVIDRAITAANIGKIVPATIPAPRIAV